MFALSTPRPNALVATMTSSLDSMNRVLRVVALALVHAAVILRRRHAPARQRLVELLDLLDGRAVDDARPRQLLQQRDQRLHLLVFVVEDDHLVVEVRTIERRRDDRRLLHPELEQDVVADVRRRGRGRREHRRVADILDRLAQRQVRGPEVVAPLRDAVRLVDDEPRHADACRTPRAGTRGTRDPPCARAWSSRSLPPGERTSASTSRRCFTVSVESILHGRDALGDHLVELILDQRDQRADDDGHARHDHRGQLVEQRLAAAGRHDREQVLAGEQVIERLGLAGPEVLDVRASSGRRRAARRPSSGVRRLPVGTGPFEVVHGARRAEARRLDGFLLRAADFFGASWPCRRRAHAGAAAALCLRLGRLGRGLRFLLRATSSRRTLGQRTMSPSRRRQLWMPGLGSSRESPPRHLMKNIPQGPSASARRSIFRFLRCVTRLSMASDRPVREAENRLERFNADRERLLAEVERRVVARRVAEAQAGGDALARVRPQRRRVLRDQAPRAARTAPADRWRDLSRRLHDDVRGRQAARAARARPPLRPDVVGNFDPRVYKFATGVGPSLLEPRCSRR